MDKLLNSQQAFNCMKCFLEKIYLRTNSDDIGSLLGDLQIMDDDLLDLAAWQDWLDCIDSTLNEKNEF